MKSVFEGKIFKIFEEEVVDSEGKAHLRERCARPNLVTVIGISENNEFVMIKEFRNGAGRSIIWFPGGRVEEGESFDLAAKREFEEETGLKAKTVKLFHTKSKSDNFLGEGKVYIARGLSKGQRGGDESTEIKTIRVPITKAAEMALNNEIKNEFFAFLILRIKYLFERQKMEL